MEKIFSYNDDIEKNAYMNWWTPIRYHRAPSAELVGFLMRNNH